MLAREFSRSMSTCLGISRCNPKTGKRWGPLPLRNSRDWPLEVLSSRIWLLYVKPYLLAFYFYVKPYQRIYGDPAEKYDISRPAFQDHSRLSEPTRIDRVTIIPYQRSIATRGLSYHFQYIARYWLKLPEIFPNWPVFDASQTRFPLEFVICACAPKTTKLVVLPHQDECLMVTLAVWIQCTSVTDRQTDRPRYNG